MDGVAGIRMRTRGAESLYGGPLPRAAKMLLCGNVPGQYSYNLSLSVNNAERLDICWTCEQSGSYDRVWIHSAGVTSTPNLQLEVFLADANGTATGSALYSKGVTPTGGTIEQFTMSPVMALIEGVSYVFRFQATTTAGGALVMHCNAGNNADGMKNGNMLSEMEATYTNAAGEVKGYGFPVFGVTMTAANYDSKTFATALGTFTGGQADCFTTQGTFKRLGFGHIPTESRMVYGIRAQRTVCKGNFALANTLSAYIYELRGTAWVEVWKGIGKKHLDTVYEQPIHWWIPQGFLLKRNSEYVVCVGPTTDNSGDSTNCMRIGEIGQYSMIPRATCAGQFGGIGEEKMWPAAFNSTPPVAFSKAVSGTALVSTGITYQYRPVPTVILP